MLVCDYDNTILVDNKIDVRINHLLEKWKSDGNIFVIATSRYYNSIIDEIQSHSISADYLICVDGCIAFKSNNCIFSHIIEENILEFFGGLISDKNLMYYSVNYGDYQSRKFFESYSNYIVDVKIKPVVSIVFCFFDEHYSKYFCDSLYNLTDKIIDVYCYSNFVKISPSNTSKANGISELLDILSEEYKVITVGDDKNDISMLNKYDGYAIENSYASNYIKKTTNSVVSLLEYIIDKF